MDNIKTIRDEDIETMHNENENEDIETILDEDEDAYIAQLAKKDALVEKAYSILFRIENGCDDPSKEQTVGEALGYLGQYLDD